MYKKSLKMLHNVERKPRHFSASACATECNKEIYSEDGATTHSAAGSWNRTT